MRPSRLILAHRAIQAGDFPIELWVETVTSRGNVRRAAEKLGCTVQVDEVGGEFRLALTKRARHRSGGGTWAGPMGHRRGRAA